MKVFLIILGILLLIFLIYAVVGGLYLFDQSVKRKPKRVETAPVDNTYASVSWRKKKQGSDWIYAQNLQPAYIKSFDNLKLYANILESPEKSNKIIIMMHGFRAQDNWDFSASVKCFYDDNYTVILPHQRAHDKSEGEYLSYGINERKDCRDWINFAVEKYGENCEIVIMGVSMGCATVLMTLGFDLPKNVKACIADCGYTSPRKIFNYVVKYDKKFPAFPVVNVCNLLCKIKAGFSIDDYSCEEALKNNKIPVLFIHGDEDRFVPYFMSEKNFKDCKSEKEFLTIRGARHAMCFETDTEKCFKTAKNFVEKYI